MACAVIMHIFLNLQVFYRNKQTKVKKKNKNKNKQKKKNENIMYPVQSWIVSEGNPNKICLIFSNPFCP